MPGGKNPCFLILVRISREKNPTKAARDSACRGGTHLKYVHSGGRGRKINSHKFGANLVYIVNLD